MLYTKITNTKMGNPRYLFQCPDTLTLPEAKKLFDCKIATDNQVISIIDSNTNDQVNLWLIFTTYNVKEVVKQLKPYFKP